MRDLVTDFRLSSWSTANVDSDIGSPLCGYGQWWLRYGSTCCLYPQDLKGSHTYGGCIILFNLTQVKQYMKPKVSTHFLRYSQVLVVEQRITDVQTKVETWLHVDFYEEPKARICRPKWHWKSFAKKRRCLSIKHVSKWKEHPWRTKLRQSKQLLCGFWWAGTVFIP
jgi:hypothetical protein